MAVTQYTSNLGLALPTTGDLAGLWGYTVNDSITNLLDSAVAGTTTISTDADVTLTTTDGVSNQARAAIIKWTATGTVTRYITAPAHSKVYVVFNNTGGTQSIVIRGVGPTTGVTVAPGAQAMVAWDGADFARVGGGDPGGSNTQVQYNNNGDLAGSANMTFNGTNLTLGNALLVGSGGTGNSATPTAGGAVYGDGTKMATTSAGTSGQVLTSNGSSAPTWQAPNTPSKAGGVLVTNTTAVTENYTIPVGTNAFSVGPITLSDTYTIIVSAGQRWVVI